MTTACHKCWSPINWKESFNKYGHSDGDDCVHTPQVAAYIRKLAYEPTSHDDTLHNVIIARIEHASTGAVVWEDGMNIGDTTVLAGTTDPSDTLPAELVAALDNQFGRCEFAA